MADDAGPHDSTARRNILHQVHGDHVRAALTRQTTLPTSSGEIATVRSISEGSRPISAHQLSSTPFLWANVSGGPNEFHASACSAVNFNVTFSPEPAVIGQCSQCGEPSSRMENCSSLSCTTESVICDSCAERGFLCEEDRAVATLAA